MPIKYTVEPENFLVYCHLTGTVKLLDVKNNFLAYTAEPDFTKGMDIIIDTDESLLDLSNLDILELAGYMLNNKPKRGYTYRIAMVVPDGSPNQKTAELYQLNMSIHVRAVEIFKTLTRARSWLTPNKTQFL